jgi:superfamily I DNA/RNA helicase
MGITMTKPMLLLGAPGTGKTHRLIQEILQRRTHSFVFLTFTRRAANEAKQRLTGYFSTQQLKYVRTIHSLCFELAGLRKEQIMNDKQIYKFANDYGLDLHPRRLSYEDGAIHNFTTDDDIEFREMQISSATLNIERLRDNPLYSSYSRFLRENGLIDYNQMIVHGIQALKDDPPKFDLLLVDEFQDLSPLQLKFIGHLQMLCKETILAGDDNQMIFEWAGVNRNMFWQLAQDSEQYYLTGNYRLPQEINILSHRIASRQQEVVTFPDVNLHSAIEGYVEHVPDSDVIIEPEQSYLFLARNNYLLDEITDGLDINGYEWAWLDDDSDLNIKVSTIHGAKGAEADNVILCTDVSPSTYEQVDSDAEHRVWYVAITRARKRLYIVQPQTGYFYDLE